MREDETFIIELELRKDNSITRTIATMGNLSRIEISSILMDDGKFVDYDTDVYYYRNNARIPMVIPGEKDYEFSKEFHIPLRLARFFRLNFKKFGKYFNIYEDTEEFPEIESYLDEKDYYAFIGSFQIKDFIGFIKGYVFANMDSALLEVLAENERFNDLKPERESVLEPLAQFIGSDGEGVITYSLYQAILLYLTGCVPSLNARGFLLQKVNDLYTLYFISFINNELHIEPKAVTHEEVQLMYEQNEFNKENKSIDSFFGVNLAR